MANESIISAIDAEIATLQQARSLLADAGKVDGVTTRRAAKKASTTQPKKRTMSPEARQRIAEAQRKRWAGTKKVNPPTPPNAMKRTLSPEARKRIAAAQKKRWARTKRLAGRSAVSEPTNTQAT